MARNLDSYAAVVPPVDAVAATLVAATRFLDLVAQDVEPKLPDHLLPD